MLLIQNLKEIMLSNIHDIIWQNYLSAALPDPKDIVKIQQWSSAFEFFIVTDFMMQTTDYLMHAEQIRMYPSAQKAQGHG